MSARARHAAPILLVLLVLLGAGACRSSAASDAVPVVDFIKEFDRAEGRPAGSFSLAHHPAGGVALPAIVGPAPSRLVWILPVPRHGVFRARIAGSQAPFRVRLGVSDTRIYEQLADLAIQPDAGWSTLTADLSDYAGWKLSLFYRPGQQQWRLNVSVDATGDAAGRIAIGVPEIVASREDALEYASRRARLTRSATP